MSNVEEQFAMSKFASRKDREQAMLDRIVALETRQGAIDSLVGDRLTAQKAEDICASQGFTVTGVMLTHEDGRRCIVNRSAVRWLDEPAWQALMFPENTRDRNAERHAAIGAAVERASMELPEGYDLHIELEKDAGTVRLYLADTDAYVSNFDGDTFHDQINRAIRYAIKDAKEGQSHG